MESTSPLRLDGDDPIVPPVQPATRYCLAIDLEPANTDLMSWWLSAEGLHLRLDPVPGDPPALILVEVAYPRHGDRERLQAIASAWPGVPIVLLSPTFFADTPARGEIARRFGVAATLATPLSRERLVATVRDLLGMPR